VWVGVGSLKTVVVGVGDPVEYAVASATVGDGGTLWVGVRWVLCYLITSFFFFSLGFCPVN
jgi:hypothetical protein